jgi:hypothetical protein
MFKVKPNMGRVDRSIRLIVGGSLMIVGPLTDLVGTDTFSNVILGCMGFVAIASAVFSHCPLYEVTGFNTRA